MPTIKPWMLNAALGLAITGAVSGASFLLFHHANEAPLVARIMDKITVKPLILKPGDMIFAHIEQRLFQICPYQIRWVLVKPNGEEAVRVVESISLENAKKRLHLGANQIDNAHTMPSDITPGDYSYSSTVVDLCPDKTYTSAYPLIPIKVR